MNLKLKICGMRDAQNITAVSALHPDYMGFIFYAQSPRYVGNDFEVPIDFPSSINRVGVFVQEQTASIIKQVKKHKLDFVQLHGGESVEQCEALKSSGMKIIKAFSVNADFDFKAIKVFKHYADYFLFDTKGKSYGGNAKVFDWSLLNKYDQTKPFFLSGGISMENISNLEKIKTMNIHALDINSGVEISPALKDVTKINELKQAISFRTI